MLGALFPVYYPAAEYYCLAEERMHTFPTIESGVYTNTHPCTSSLSVRTLGSVVGLHSGKYPEIDGYQMLAEMADMMFPACQLRLVRSGVPVRRVAVTQATRLSELHRSWVVEIRFAIPFSVDQFLRWFLVDQCVRHAT